MPKPFLLPRDLKKTPTFLALHKAFEDATLSLGSPEALAALAELLIECAPKAAPFEKERAETIKRAEVARLAAEKALRLYAAALVSPGSEIEADDICTADFVRSHGREPRGHGVWGFFFDGKNAPNEVWWAGPACSFTEAKKRALLEAHNRCAYRIEVAS